MAGAGVRDILLDGPWRHRDIAANGIRFHVAVGEHLAPDRPLVILLHGFGEFWWAWRHQIPALDAAGLSVAAMDLRGYGASDKTPRGYDPHTTAYDVAGVIRSLGFSRAVVVGHDWGGLAAWSTLAYAPGGRTCDGAGRGAASAGLSVAAESAERWPSSRCRCCPSAGSWPTTASSSRICSGRRAADGPGLMSTDGGPALPGRPDALAEPALRAGVPADVRPATACAQAGRDYRRALPRAGSRAVAVHPRPARPPGPARVDDRRGAVGRSRHDVVSLPGVGHLPHEEAPDAVTGALTAWLADLPAERL